MRGRILRVAVLAVMVAVTVLGVPLAVAVHVLLYSGETKELERLALRGAVAVSPDFARRDPIELPPTEGSVELGIYDRAANRVAGRGPAHGDTAVLRSLRGQVTDQGTSDQLVVAVPVSVGEDVVAVSRAASPRDAVRQTVVQAWGGMFVLSLAAGGCAYVFAAAQARRVSKPLERLVEVARELGAGNFQRRVERSGVEEIDRAGDALNVTAAQLDDLLARERAFSAHASHQLRTPLTSLRLGLEAALDDPRADLKSAAERAVVAAEHLSQTVDDVLALARGTATNLTAFGIHEMLAGARARWHGPLAARGRPLVIAAEGGPDTAVGSEQAVRQILDVLIDNALQHGQGAVKVVVRETDTAVGIDVIDEGSTRNRHLIPTDGDRPPANASAVRLGLTMAAALAQRQGGRLLHARTESQTRMTLLLRQGNS